MDGLYLYDENDTKMWFFNFRSSKISLRLNPPKVTVLTVQQKGNDFIHVKIPHLIAKLTYCIRAIIFTELMKREGQEFKLKDDLDGLHEYMPSLSKSLI